MRVAIVGYALSSRFAPWADESCEIWMQNYAEVLKYLAIHQITRKPSRIFEIHGWDTIVKEGNEVPGDTRLEAMTSPENPTIYMKEVNRVIPCSKQFPLDELTREFFPWAKKVNGKWDDVYWTSTSQMMIALAIYEEAEEISIYGVDMADTIEYRNQRKGCEYMLGIAVGRNITIHRPDDCPILRTRFIYGYEVNTERAFRTFMGERVKWVTEQLQQTQNNGMEMLKKQAYLQGMLDNTKLFEQNWIDNA